MSRPDTRTPAWLAERRTGIGGSDVAAILGLNEWTSPYTVWADKLGLLPEREDSEAMRQGRDLEHYVAERFSKVSGKRVRRVNRILRHPVIALCWPTLTGISWVRVPVWSVKQPPC